MRPGVDVGEVDGPRRGPPIIGSCSATVIGPLQGPIGVLPVSPGPTDLRPVRPGAYTSQGRWPCAGLRPALTQRQLAACLIAEKSSRGLAIGSESTAGCKCYCGYKNIVLLCFASWKLKQVSQVVNLLTVY